MKLEKTKTDKNGMVYRYAITEEAALRNKQSTKESHARNYERLAVDVPKGMLEALTELAARRGVSRRKMIIDVLWRELKKGECDMRRKYGDCQRKDGNCTVCPLVCDGNDCHGRPISKLEWARRAADLTQPELAEKSGVNIRLVQKVENGEALAGNLTARNLLALADALGVDAKSLI